MRSIRRSLTLYLFVLLAFMLGVVWIVIDQATARALDARETAGRDLIRARYESRCQEERDRTDQALLLQARTLGNLMTFHYRDRITFATDMANWRKLMSSAPLLFLTSPISEAGWVSLHGTTARPNPAGWSLFRTYFSNLGLPEEYLRHVEDETHFTDYHQINTTAGREWHSRSLGGRKLPFDPRVLDEKHLEPGKHVESTRFIDWVIGDAVIGPDNEPVRRVLYKVPHYQQTPQMMFRGPRPPLPPRGDRGEERRTPPPSGFGPFGPDASSSMRGWNLFWIGWAVSGFGPPPSALPFPPPSPPNFSAPPGDSFPRLYIQCARSQSVLDAALAGFALDRDQELQQLGVDIDNIRTTLRLQISLVGLLVFLAVVLGVPLIVGAGLRPIGRLSDAVSRVSERDFKLPHDGTDLVAELAPIHARLTQTFDLLQKAFSREKQAVADISHELKTPITALMATIDVALRKTRTAEQYRSALEECRTISKQLGMLVERIMTLATLDAGNDRTLIVRTDVNDLSAGCAGIIRPLAMANGITLHYVPLEEPLEIDTDAGKLREVLMNLLHNAVEYNRPQGSIDFHLYREASTLVFEIRDTGIGIPPEMREKIFERFYRADSSRHATGVHAGLGLSIVKEYTALLNGTIRVDSEAGVGSTFRLFLPIPMNDPAQGDRLAQEHAAAR
jgi:signal transduction histidine kinase